MTSGLRFGGTLGGGGGGGGGGDVPLKNFSMLRRDDRGQRLGSGV